MLGVVFTLTAVLVVTLPAAKADSAEEASEDYEKALEYFHDGQLKAAFIETKNALQSDSRHIGARLLQGRIFLALGNGAAAEDAFVTARRFGASDEISLTLLADAYIMQRKFDEFEETIVPGVHGQNLAAAVHAAHGRALIEQGRLVNADVEFSIAARLAPGLPEALVGQAALHLHHGEVKLATELVDRVTSDSPSFPQGWYLKGELQKLSGELEQALASFDKAISADPYYIIARNARGELLIGLERSERAFEDIYFVQDIRPLDPTSTYLYALYLAREGRDEEVDVAMLRLRHALDRLGAAYVQDHPPSLRLSGLAYFREGNFKEAEVALTTYLRHAPGDTTTRKLLGALLLRYGKTEKAVRMLESALVKRPEDPQLLALLGSAYLKLRETSRATELLEQAVALAPDANEIRTQLAMTRLAVGRRKDAIDELESVLEVDPESAQAALTVGLIYLRKGDFEAALGWAERIRERDPDSVVAESLRGAAFAGLERFPEARASFESVLEREPGNHSAAYNLAELDLAEGNADRAKERYTAIVHDDQTEARAIYKLASMERDRGNIEAAISWYEKLRAVAPDAVMNQIELLELYLQTQQPKRALAIAKDLERRHPENMRVLLGVGRAQLALNDLNNAKRTFRRMSKFAVYNAGELQRIAEYQILANDADGARWSLQKALQSEPTHLPALISMAELDRETGNMDEALATAEKIRRVHPQAEAGYLLVGNIYAQGGRLSEAIAAYEAGMQIVPTSSLAIRMFLTRIEFAGDDERTQNAALGGLAGWIKANPNDIDAIRAYATAHIYLGRVDEAVRLHLKLLDALPDDPAALNSLAYAYEKLGDPRALEYATQAFELAPKQPAVLDTYGWVLTRQGQPEKALKHLREARILAPNDAEIRYHLGVTLHELGRDKEAVRELQSALQESTSFDGATEAAALLSQLAPRS